MPDRATPRILIVTRHYAPEAAGSGPVIQTMAEWLAANGYRTEVVTVRPSYPATTIFEGYAEGERDTAVEQGVHILRLPTWPARKGGIGGRIAAELRFAIDLFRLRCSGRIEPHMTVMSLCPSILAVAAAGLFRKPGGRHVALIHDIPSGLGRALGLSGIWLTGLSRMIERSVLNRADHLIVLSDAMRDVLREMGVHTPILVQPPPLDTTMIKPMRKAVAKPIALYSGNLGRKQGIGQILDAATILRNTAPSLRIEIRGDGAMKEALLRKASDEDLSNVSFLPFAPKEALAESLGRAAVHLIPQLPEGSAFAVPSKAYTIMAAGRPFIATASAGSPLARLAAESGGGICVEPNDPEALAEVIRSLIADRDRCDRMGIRGRLHVERYAETDVVMDAIMGLIGESQPLRLAAE